MADFKMPTFDDAPAAATPKEASAPVAAPEGFKMPVFEESPNAKMKPFVGDDGKPVDTAGIDKSVFNGALFGLGDRARAVFNTVTGGKSYDDNLNKVLAERQDFNDKNPSLHYITEGLPGAVTGAGVTSLAKGALSKVAPAVAEYAAGSGVLNKVVGQLGNLGLAGAFGAAGGAGSAKPGETLEGAKDGAIMGAGVTLGLQGVGKLGGAAINLATPMVQKALMAMGLTDPNKWAERKMVETLLGEGHSIESVVAKMKDMSNKGAWAPQADNFVGPPMEVAAKPVVLADALPAKALGMLKKAGKEPGAAEIIQGRLGQRAVETPDRLANDIATNISPRTGASAEAERIITERAQASKPLYDQAFAVGTPHPDQILPFFDTPLKKSLFKDVEGAARGAGEPFTGRMVVDPKTQEFKIVETPSIADLHEMRKHLSDVKQSMWNDDAGKYVGWGKIGGEKYNISRINKAMEDLTGQIENLTGGSNGSYAQARKVFADDSSVLDALRKGGNIIKTRPEDVAIEFGKLKSDAERDAYRAGISSILTDKTGSTADGKAILKTVFGNKNIRDKLDQVYPDNSARMLFPKQMAAEQRMQDTTKILAPKVQQADYLESGGEASLPAALANFAAGRTVAGAANAARFISGQADRMAPQYGEQLARLGMMNLPEAETFAADFARRNNGPLSQAMRAVKSGVKAVGRQVPYEAGNLASRQDEGGALERYRQLKK